MAAKKPVTKARMRNGPKTLKTEVSVSFRLGRARTSGTGSVATEAWDISAFIARENGSNNRICHFEGIFGDGAFCGGFGEGDRRGTVTEL